MDLNILITQALHACNASKFTCYYMLFYMPITCYYMIITSVLHNNYMYVMMV